MRVTFVSAAPLSAGLCQPGADLWYSWSTATWTTPFNAAAHLLPLAPVEVGPSVVDTIVTADLTTAAYTPGASVFVFQTEPLLLVSPLALVSPLGPPSTYGPTFA
jgi:hypothetical protein